jgi:tRNA pseudouridine55 synthase
MKRTQKMDGIFILDKPLGLSSNQALQKVKRLFEAEKAGHTGSLDPLATGVLPICFGRATRFSDFLLSADKQYEVEICLGIRTTTGDKEGTVVLERPVPLYSVQDIETVVAGFVGKQLQTPPMYSAIKKEGVPLYVLARQGIEVERTPRAIEIYAIEVIGVVDQGFKLFVHSSKGVYIRTLVEDMGERLGCGAHVSALRRVASGPYVVGDQVTLADLEALDLAGRHRLLRSVESIGALCPTVHLSAAELFLMRQGQAVTVLGISSIQGPVRLCLKEGECFVGLGEVSEGCRVLPRHMIVGA